MLGTMQNDLLFLFCQGRKVFHCGLVLGKRHAEAKGQSIHLHHLGIVFSAMLHIIHKRPCQTGAEHIGLGCISGLLSAMRGKN